MKKGIIICATLFISVATILFSSCIKAKVPVPLSSYNLSAYANGSLLTFNASCTNYGDSILNVFGQWNSNGGNDYAMIFNNIMVTKKFIGTYLLNSNPSAVYHFYLSGGSGGGYIFAYGTDSTHTGTFTITTYDSINKNISGTFNFTGVGGSNGNPYQSPYSSTTLTITNGVFTKVPL